MRKFVLRSLLFLSPFMLALGVELFLLPIDFFTFRVWEAVIVKKYLTLLPGPFYPNMEIKKMEEGDLAAHTRFAVKKKVRWVTDRYGYRKGNTDDPQCQIVIVGDSSIAGSGLSQESIFSEILEDQLKVNVYPLSPAKIDHFLENKNFKDHPPEVVILASVEREITSFLPLQSRPEYRKGNARCQSLMVLKENTFVQPFVVFLDRLSKANMLHYFRTSLRRTISRTKESRYQRYVFPKYGPIFFFMGASANQEVPRVKLEKTVGIIKSYHEAIRSRGIRFIFLPIPEKENIFYESLHTKKPIFLKQLISELKSLGIETIDTQKAFEDAYRHEGELLFQTDDTHWNEKGVKITAELVKKMIARRE